MTWIVDFSRYTDGSTYITSYADIRALEYVKAFGERPEDQFDFIFKNGIDIWSEIISDIKSQIPKTLDIGSLKHDN